MSKIRSIIQHRRGTTNEWTASTVIPEAGEIIIEECDNGTKKIKLGDGKTLFKDLPYVSGTGGGGTSTGGASLAINYITLSPLYITVNDGAVLKFSFAGTDSSGDTIRKADAVWTVNSTVVAYGSVKDGINEFDIRKYISAGTSYVRLTVTDLNGNSTSKDWEIECLEFSIESSFDDKNYYQANKSVIFNYTPIGSIDKIAIFKLDGVEIGRDENLNSSISGVETRFEIPAQEHGSHLLEVYLEGKLPDGTELEPTEPIIKDLLFYDPTSEIPIIGNTTPTLKIKQYAAQEIIFTVYDPKADIPEVNIFVDDELKSTLKLNPNPDYNNTPTGNYSYSFFEVGSHIIKIVCRGYEKIINVDVEKLDVNIAPVTVGLAFDFNPVGYNNNDIINRLWNYENKVHMSVSDNFDWINGGYISNDPDGPCFLIKAGSSATIDYKLFADDAKQTGKEFKFVFKVTNVSDPDTVFLSCIDNTTNKDHIGIEMRPQVANIYGQNGNLELAYSEDDAIEFEFNISKYTDKVPMIMGYEDGVPTRPMVYDSSYNFTQNTPKEITIGSPDCDVYIYRFKVYNTSLSNTEILSNFIADARDVESLISRYTRNQIYDINNKLTAETLAEKCPWLRVYKVEAPHFTNSKSDKVSNTIITQIYKNGDPVLDNWVCTGAQHSGQGTSSNNYGAAGRNLDFIMNIDGAEFTLGDKSKTSEISLTRESVPVAYLNAKVNIASSNNLTNAILANRYNQFNPYRRPFIREEGYPLENIKDTMEMHNCVIFIKESDPDLTTHREFNDTDWHFYAIGNIGDSKKTDETRTTDPSDPYECCIELMDVKLPLSDFPVDTMINAMAQKENDKKELEYVWAKESNRDILFERKYKISEDDEVNLNKIYYIDLPVKKQATGPQLSIENLENLYDRIYRLSEDTKTNKDKIYYKDEEGTLATKEDIEATENPKEAKWYEWHKEYKKTTDTEIIKNKLYYIEILEKSNAMEFTYETVRKYLAARDENLNILYEFINGEYVLTSDTTVDLNKTYYTKYEEKNANGDIIDTTYTDAMGYINEQRKVYTYATKENLKNRKLYEISYFKTEGPIDPVNKTYYVDILENDDFSEDYTYGWRYSKNKKNKDITSYCHQKWIEFYRFVTTSTDEDFKKHLKDYFVVDSALYYYLFTERYCMVDNRAKNTFWHYGKTTDLDSDGNPIRKWDLCWDYDNDTSLGLNNYGKQVYRYGLEDTDIDESGEEIFREMDSLFFCRLRDLFGPELKAMFNTLEQSNAWHAESFINKCDEWQDEFPEELWRLDIERKYIRTYTTSFINGKPDAQFLTNMCNGKMKYQRRQWERNQEQYMSSKYQTTRASGDNYHANFRFGTPSSPTSSSAIPANYQLTLTPYAYMYLNVQYGGTTPSTIRVTDTNINTPITVPFYGNAADIVNVYNASAIRDFGDLSAAYPKTVSVGNASRMKKLTLGNSKTGYKNTVFTTLTTDANPLLEELDVTNIESLTQTLDLSRLVNLKSLKACGTSTSSILFADNGKLEDLELPAVNGLSFKNLKYLASENIYLESYDNVVSLIVENCPLINKLELLENCKNLQRLRLTDVDLGEVTYKYFEDNLFKLKGVAANGEDITENAYITGVCYIETLTGDQYNEISSRYPNLTINFGTLQTKVVFMDIYGKTELMSVDLTTQNSQPYAEYNGITPTDITLAPSKKYNYTFDGWTTKKVFIPDSTSTEYHEFEAPTREKDVFKTILGTRILYPAFQNEIRIYPVYFYNPSRTGDKLLQTTNTFYGHTAEYPAESTPIKQDTAKPDNYEFIGWSDSLENITGETKFYAQFKLKDNAYYKLKISDVSIKYVNNNQEICINSINNKSEPIIEVPESFTIGGKEYKVTVLGVVDSHTNHGCFQGLAIEYIKLPNTIKEIYENTFRSCTSLLSIDLPDSLVSIGSRTFVGCELLETIKIPKNVESIASTSAPFSYDMKSLTKIEVDADNKYYYVQDGCLIDKRTKTILMGTSSAKIPMDGSITNIALYAFAYAKIKDITFPNTSLKLGECAFAYCEELNKVTIPTNCELDATVFSWCSNLSEVTFQPGIKNIKSYDFYGCPIEELVLPDTITQIGTRAFADNKALRSVTFTHQSDQKIKFGFEETNPDHTRPFEGSGSKDGVVFNLPWSQSEDLDGNCMDKAPWGANYATINYDYKANNF